MAIARLPVIIVLIQFLLQNSVQGQQLSLANKSTSNNPTATDQKIAALISSAQNQAPKSNNGNTGSSANIQSNKAPPLTGLKQFLNLQQPPQQLNTPLDIQSQPATQPACGNQNSQQILNLQPSLNFQPALNLQPAKNFEQPPSQNLQLLALEPQTYFQQPLNHQQCYNNLQQQNVQLQQSLSNQQINTQNSQNSNSQQLVLQQQSTQTIPLSNLQIIGQQEIPLGSLPVVNGQLQGLPSQVTQGMLLSNLGLTSSLPSILPTPSEKSVEQVVVPQNNGVSLSNIPYILLDRSANTLTLSASPTYFSTDGAKNNNPTQVTSFVMPKDLQSIIFGQQNELDDLIIHPINPQCNQPSYQISIQPVQMQSIPAQCTQTVPVQTQTGFTQQIQTQPECIQQVQIKPDYTQQLQTQAALTHETPIQSAPIQFVQQQPAVTPVQSVPIQSVQQQPVVTQPLQAQQIISEQPNCYQTQPMSVQGSNDPLVSFLMSQLQPSSNSQFPSPFPTKPKSSSMKALLPLLFNLLNEKNGGCGCPNCNCGCMNNNNCNNNSPDFQTANLAVNNANSIPQNGIPCMSGNNYYNNYNQELSNNDNYSNVKEPKILGGYANQIKYGQPQEKKLAQNVIDSGEIEIPKKQQGKKKYENYKSKPTESEEYATYEEDYGDSYEMED